MLKCSKCNKGMHQIKCALVRTNPKGQPGIFECSPHCGAELTEDEFVKMISDDSTPLDTKCFTGE